MPLNIFYQEPDPDRWFKYDRYPRRLARRLLRSKQRPGSIMMVALGLMSGLDKLKVPYRFNDYKYIKRHPEELACIIGKPHLLDARKWSNPIIFGAGTFSHPEQYPDILTKHPNIKKILVPGPWMRQMFAPYYGNEMVSSWPVGIDTEKWKPGKNEKSLDFLIYSKFLWEKGLKKIEVLEPIIAELSRLNLSFEVITYGNYTHELLKSYLDTCRQAIFLCEHESQGMAYQQMLATDVPLFAWDQEAYWLDPAFYPHKVKFKPVSSVPYWDDRCGMKFQDIDEFKAKLSQFITRNAQGAFSPRSFILDNLTLEKSALAYLNIVNSISEDTSAH